MKNQKGFTLVELIIVIAIMAFSSLAVVGLMNTSLHTYSSTNADLDNQYESQLVMNQLHDLLIDANNTVKWEPDDENGGSMSIYNNEIDDSGTEKLMITVIRWDKASSKLYYSQYEYSLGGVRTEVVPECLMGENVTDFSADVTNLEKNRQILFTLAVTAKNKTISTNKTVTLRNEVELAEASDTDDEIFAPDQDGIGRVTGISIQEKQGLTEDLRIFAGSTKVFHAKVTTINGASKLVRWSLTGAVKEGTVINELTGALTIDPDEPENTVLTVTAQSRYNQSFTDTMNVRVGEKLNVEISLSENIPDYVLQGETFSCHATIIGNGTRQAKWSLTGNTAGDTYISNAGQVYVSKSETADSLTVRYTSEEKPEVYGEKVIYIVRPSSIAFSDQTENPDSVFRGGAAVNYSVIVTVSPEMANSENGNAKIDEARKVDWSIRKANSIDTKISDSGVLMVSKDETAKEIVIVATSRYNKELSVTKTVKIDRDINITLNAGNTVLNRGENRTIECNVKENGASSSIENSDYELRMTTSSDESVIKLYGRQIQVDLSYAWDAQEDVSVTIDVVEKGGEDPIETVTLTIPQIKVYLVNQDNNQQYFHNETFSGNKGIILINQIELGNVPLHVFSVKVEGIQNNLFHTTFQSGDSNHLRISDKNVGVYSTAIQMVDITYIFYTKYYPSTGCTLKTTVSFDNGKSKSLNVIMKGN